MSISVIAKGFELTESIKTHSIEQIQKACRAMESKVSSFRLTATAVSHKHSFTVKCVVSFEDGHKKIAVSENGEDLYTCIDEATATVVEISEKEHTKKVKEKRHIKRPDFSEEETED